MYRCIRSVATALVVFQANSVFAGYEWWHHLYDMSGALYVCMDSCTHVDNTGSYTTVTQDEESDVLLDTKTSVVNLSETCHAQGTVTFNGAVTATRSMAVSASDWAGGSVQYGVTGNGGWDIGESAKASVGGSIGWTHSWNWVVTGTYTEGYSMTAGATVAWPQSGERKVTGSGAKVSCDVKVYGDKATFSLEARRQHYCSTTVKYTVYTNDDGQHICNSWIWGDVVKTTYSGDGDLKFSGSATGENPKRVELGAIVEEGPIQAGCGST